MTTEEKAALIADCQTAILRIEKSLPHWQKSTYTLSYLESEMARQKIALAALTAEPAPEKNQLIAAINRLLNSDGSRGTFSAIRSGEAREEVERLLAAAPTP